MSLKEGDIILRIKKLKDFFRPRAYKTQDDHFIEVLQEGADKLMLTLQMLHSLMVLGDFESSELKASLEEWCSHADHLIEKFEFLNDSLKRKVHILRKHMDKKEATFIDPYITGEIQDIQIKEDCIQIHTEAGNFSIGKSFFLSVLGDSLKEIHYLESQV